MFGPQSSDTRDEETTPEEQDDCNPPIERVKTLSFTRAQRDALLAALIVASSCVAQDSVAFQLGSVQRNRATDDLQALYDRLLQMWR